MCGICPLVCVVPLKLSEQVEKVKVDPSGPLTVFKPPSPLLVLPPWFRNRKAYFTFSYKQNIVFSYFTLIKYSYVASIFFSETSKRCTLYK